MSEREIRFGANTIFARCWCESCGWEIHPTGWYDDDGPITLDELIATWQDDHDGAFSVAMGGEMNECQQTIEWEEVE